jgi:hypothetical protein
MVTGWHLVMSAAVSSNRMRHAQPSPVPSGLCITHISRCVRPGCKHSPWRGLPAHVPASSHRCQVLAVAAGAQARTKCNNTATPRYRMYA